MNRISKFLALDELDEDTTDYGSVADGEYDSEIIDGMIISWPSTSAYMYPYA